MKKVVLILLSFLFLFPVYAQTIKGGVSYSVQEAREISFQDIEKNIDISKYQESLIDKKLKENIKGLSNNKLDFIDRKLIKFFDNNNIVTYSVTYKKNKNVVYFYNNKGYLQYIDFIDRNLYPKRTLSYTKNGYLDSIALSVSNDNQFVFDVNKRLIAHWIGKNCYDENGGLIGTRD